MTHENKIDPKLCVLCRGGKYLCKLAFCPLIVKTMVYQRIGELKTKQIIQGSTPPSVFIGRIGYPKIRVGPVAPPVLGDTAIYDLPEYWLEMKLEDILNFRFSMIRGYKVLDVENICNRDILVLQEATLSTKPVDIEIEIEKPINDRILLDEHIPPLGPSSPYRKLLLNSNPSIPKVTEKVYNDTDLKAKEAIIKLYENDLPLSYIQKTLSIGALGTKKNRRLVPTRWSITTVDDIISKYLISKIKYYESIDKIYLFILNIHLNSFIGLLLPREWSYEWGEAWFPGSTWNPFPYGKIMIETDWESINGRRDYASTGGCYYAARLAAVEYLFGLKRQASVVIWREIYPGFNLPIGVWFVRESVRKMFSQKPIVLESLQEALKIINRHSKVGVKQWTSSSKLLSFLKSQGRITDWIVRSK